MVFFYDYDDVVKFMIDKLSYSELWRLRINIYNYCHDSIKFTSFWEVDLNWNKYEWYNIDSPVILLSYDEFAKLYPNSSLKNKFYIWDKIKERFVLRSSFIDYVKLECPSM